MKKKQKNYLVYFEEGGKTTEKQLYSYQVAQALTEATGGHLLIIIS